MKTPNSTKKLCRIFTIYKISSSYHITPKKKRKERERDTHTQTKFDITTNKLQNYAIKKPSSQNANKNWKKKKNPQTHTEGIDTVSVTSVTDNALFFLNRSNNDLAIIFLFWVIPKWPKSSISDSVRPENDLLERKLIKWMNLAFRCNCEANDNDDDGEQQRGAAKAASMRAISSSLTISIGISGVTFALLTSWDWVESACDPDISF